MVVAAVQGDRRHQPVVVVVEWWWPLLLSDVVGLAAKGEEVVVFSWFGCALVVVSGMLEVVVAVRVVVVVGRWQQAADVAVVRVVTRCWAV